MELFPGNMHIYTLHPKYMKFCAVELTILNTYGQNSKFKGAETPRKIKELEFPGNVHIYTVHLKYLHSFTKFS